MAAEALELRVQLGDGLVEIEPQVDPCTAADREPIGAVGEFERAPLAPLLGGEARRSAGPVAPERRATYTQGGRTYTSGAPSDTQGPWPAGAAEQIIAAEPSPTGGERFSERSAPCSRSFSGAATSPSSASPRSPARPPRP